MSGGSAAPTRGDPGHRGDPGVEDRLDAAPFAALRYDPAIVGDLAGATAPAYDALDRASFAAHRTANPYTVLELLAAADGYRGAAGTYRRWRRTGVLRKDPQPAYYRYEVHWLRAGVPVVQRGVVAAVGVAGLLPHEQVDPARVADRLQRLEAVPVDVAPVYALVHGAPDAFGALLERGPSGPPVVAVTDEAGVDHRVWRVDDAQDMASLRALLRHARAVVADGHHRWAAAQARGGRVLTYLVDADHAGPDVRGVHRLLPHLPDDVLRRLEATCVVEALDREPAEALAELAGPGVVLHRGDGGTVVLRPRPDALAQRMPPGHGADWTLLDTAVAEHLVLPVLGVAAEQVRHMPSLTRTLAAVRRGDAGGAILVRPVPTATVFKLAAAGELLPPKSTSFTPKPRTGLLLREVAAAPSHQDHPA